MESAVRNDHALTSICHICMLGAPEIDLIGPTPAGFRMNWFITGGEVDGPRLKGVVRAQGCADWAIVRPDDIVDVDVRLTLETHDGALIFMTYTGIAILGPGGSERVYRGEPPAAVIPLRIAARMSTASAAYAWVNRLLFVGVGATVMDSPNRIDYDIYALE